MGSWIFVVAVICWENGYCIQLHQNEKTPSFRSEEQCDQWAVSTGERITEDVFPGKGSFMKWKCEYVGEAS